MPFTLEQLKEQGVGTRQEWIEGSVAIGINADIAAYSWDLQDRLFNEKESRLGETFTLDMAIEGIQSSEADGDLLVAMTKALFLLEPHQFDSSNYPTI